MARLKEGEIVSMAVIENKGWMAVFLCVGFPDVDTLRRRNQLQVYHYMTPYMTLRSGFLPDRKGEICDCLTLCVCSFLTLTVDGEEAH